MDEEASDKHKLPSTRTSFFNNLLKRTNSKVQAVRYEDTSAAFPVSFGNSPAVKSTNKRFKILSSKPENSDDMASSAESAVPLLVQFYDPVINAEDFHGRTLDEMLEWDDQRLEKCHDYIQVLFPLPEGSVFNMAAPLITRKVMETFLERSDLRGRLRQAFELMLDFYGFMLSEETEDQSDKLEEEITEPKESRDPEGDERGTEKQRDDHEQPDYNSIAEHSKQGDTQAPGSEVQPILDQATQVQGSLATPAEAGEAANEFEDRHHDASNLPTEATVSSNAQDKMNAAASAKTTDQTQQGHKAHLPGTIQVVRAPHWKRAFKNWAIRFDHNHLRMTRILRSLRVLGLQKESMAFYQALKEVFNDEHYHIIGRSLDFWRKAVKNPLHIAPDGERVNWLKRWVEEQKRDAEAEEQGDTD